ncbi:MAG: hypothetical protein KAT68_08095 [Bacteroidales bacterium]|nr:hypothetical protein [Bacteroidales bacterium]
MNKSSLIIFIIIICINYSKAQKSDNEIIIEEMKWGVDYNIHIKLSNDSNYIFDIKALHHSGFSFSNIEKNEFTYYPVNLGKDFISQLKSKKIEMPEKTESILDSTDIIKSKTLWSSLHNTLGGGWVHFVNCLLYSLESGQLNITSPLMKRPESDWKPNPITETYKRTRKWKYYIPVNQKYARKEYKIRKRNGQLGNIDALPNEFIELFLKTNNAEYLKMQDNNESNNLARIYLIKILLGANYLGITQIDYIKSKVLYAVLKYSVNQLPSVIIIDNFNAAVAMTLDTNGYKIEKIVFSDEKLINETEIEERKEKIYAIIKNINEVNQSVFEEKLKEYYY